MKTELRTTIFQSEKLVELGLDKETADMYYPNRTDIPREYVSIRRLFVDATPCPLLSQEIPCWSLGRLLELIPHFINVKGTECSLRIYPNGLGDWDVEYTDWNDDYTPFHYNDKSLIDAVFYMICNLSEHGYIKKGE